MELFEVDRKGVGQRGIGNECPAIANDKGPKLLGGKISARGLLAREHGAGAHSCGSRDARNALGTRKGAMGGEGLRVAREFREHGGILRRAARGEGGDGEMGGGCGSRCWSPGGGRLR